MRISDWSSDVCSSDLITVCVANPRRSLWRCKLRGGGAGGYVSFGGGYAGVEGGYVAACRKVLLLDRNARIVQIKPQSLVRRYPTRGLEITPSRKRLAYGKSVNVLVTLGVRLIIKKK